MNELFNTLLVVEDPEPITDEQLKAVLKDYDSFRDIIVNYIKSFYERTGADKYQVFIYLPYADIGMIKVCLTDERSIETVHLPFMFCDLGLWNHLLEHPNNPLFKLLRLFETYTKNILSILSAKGVKHKLTISNSNMEEYKILDILNLHEYIGLYSNFSDFIKRG